MSLARSTVKKSAVTRRDAQLRLTEKDRAARVKLLLTGDGEWAFAGDITVRVQTSCINRL